MVDGDVHRRVGGRPSRLNAEPDAAVDEVAGHQGLEGRGPGGCVQVAGDQRRTVAGADDAAELFDLVVPRMRKIGGARRENMDAEEPKLGGFQVDFSLAAPVPLRPPGNRVSTEDRPTEVVVPDAADIVGVLGPEDVELFVPKAPKLGEKED